MTISRVTLSPILERKVLSQWTTLDQMTRAMPRGAAIDFIANRFTDFRVRRSLRIMQERFIEDLEMEQLDREAGLSRPHFFNLLKRQMGVTTFTLTR